jgi:hypothetical protein
MPEVVDSHLHLKTILRLPSFWHHHHTSIVDQEINFGTITFNKF